MKEQTVKKVLGRTGDEEKIAKFSIWVLGIVDRLEESTQYLIEETGTYEIGYQKKIGKFVAELKTTQEDLATEVEDKLKEIGFEETDIIRIVI